MGCGMVSLVLLIIGIIIILLSIIFIKNQSTEYNITEEFDENNDDLVLTLESLESIIDEINVTFNNTINQIERKYDMLETKIEQVDIKASENNQAQTVVEHQQNFNYENNNNKIDDEINSKQDESIDKKSSRIKELKNRGMSIPQIARTLNIGIGEVLLIINLSKG